MSRRHPAKSKLHDVALREFAQANGLTVKQEALNALSLSLKAEDLDVLLDHVATAPSEIYSRSRPLTAVAQLAKLVGASKVRTVLYAGRDEADTPEVRARSTELIEYLRMEH